MKKVIISALLMLSASLAASADDSISLPLPVDGHFVTSCGVQTYVTPPSAIFGSFVKMIDFYNQENYKHCGTLSGWEVLYNNKYWNANTLIYLPIDFNPTYGS